MATERQKNRRQPNDAALRFDSEAAAEIAESFAAVSGIQCRLCTRDGKQLSTHGPEGAGCSFCRRLSGLSGKSFDCEGLHAYGAQQAERFGGRYIYFCPAGMAFSASPIIAGGIAAGEMIAGPVLIMDYDDFLASDVISLGSAPETELAQLRSELLQVPKRTPKELDYISRQLFANAVFVGDSSHEMFLARTSAEQQSSISEYVFQLKESSSTPQYPVETEQELCSAIARGDRAAADDMLNRILGYIYFYIGDADVIRTRITELLIMFSRAAISGGANTEQILGLSHQYLQDLRHLGTQEELTRYLAASLNRFTNLVFNMLDGRHTRAIADAVDYIGVHYAEHLTLESVAKHVGYSPTYFSRIFREQTGSTFKEHMNALRIEKSKTLLLSGSFKVSDVCSMVGFSDQSYFCKTFRRICGVTPDKFRKRPRRLDTHKELGLG
jgi:two-component system response regulator YesN